ncbi:MAG: phosphoribosylformylglycinamidine synthase subunit PurS [Candidatus Omnitrophica bacterium]|nr:phosphoribosylformylglycinamidine synthase subunit PurS [Candidatus Omnitrophota bacterium]
MLEANVYVRLKKTITDPQGLAIKHALDSLDYKDIEQVRVGKVITLRLDTKDKKTATRQIDEMSKKVLANPIIEDYSFDIKGE